jgi:HK97 gp10 family phage protein
MPQIVKVEGLSDLVAALEDLGKSTARNTLRRTLRIAAKPVADHAQALAPRLTGRLQLSIIVGNRLTRRQARDRREDGPAFAEVYVGTASGHGVVQEFGTYKMSAHPFMRPAWDSDRERVLDTIKSELSVQIEKSAARAARKAAKLARG